MPYGTNKEPVAGLFIHLQQCCEVNGPVAHARGRAQCGQCSSQCRYEDAYRNLPEILLFHNASFFLTLNSALQTFLTTRPIMQACWRSLLEKFLILNS